MFSQDALICTSVYNEDPTQWFTELCDLLPGIRVSWFIYSKSPRSTDVKLHGRKCVTVSVVVTHLPNVGREGHSWLTHMLRGDHARTCNVFLQGHPEVNMKRVASWVLRQQVAEASKDHFHAFHRSRFIKRTQLVPREQNVLWLRHLSVEVSETP